MNKDQVTGLREGGGSGRRTRRHIGDELANGEMTQNDGQFTHFLKLLNL